MRAIQLYAAGIADAVLEGKASVPQVAVGEDEFVELDEAGNPRKKVARGRQRPQPEVRRKAIPRRRPPPIKVPVVAGVEPVEDEETEGDEVAEAVAASVVVPAPVDDAAVRRPSGSPPRRKGRGDGGD